MNSEILAGLDFFERDKGIKREVLLEAINNAVLAAARKAVGPAKDLRVEIDPKSGDIRALANLLVVEDVQNPQDEIALAKARRIKPDAKVGDAVEVEVEHHPRASREHDGAGTAGTLRSRCREPAKCKSGADGRQ